MRSFIAVDITDDMRSAVEKLQERLKGAEADVKWVAPQNMHLTLKFLGDTPEEKEPDLKAVLDRVAGNYRAFDISLFKLGAFPKLDLPKVVWVGIDNNCGLIEEIAGKIDTECEKAGFLKETRAFSAHLTIGRVTSLKNKDKLKQMLLDLSVPALSSRITEIVLYKSVLTRQGPVYTSLHKAVLI